MMWDGLGKQLSIFLQTFLITESQSLNFSMLLIMAFLIFILVKGMNALSRLGRKAEEEIEEATTKKCPFCCSEIAVEALRCPHCTSVLESNDTEQKQTAENA